MHQKTQNHFLNFLYICLLESPGKITHKHMENPKANLWKNLSTGTPPKCFRTILCLLQLQFTIDIFFKTAVLRKLFDIRFSFKHCNFSPVCLLVKMASKTVTRSICLTLRLRANGRNNSQHCCANNVGSCWVRVGSGVQTDATTPNNVVTCSASWEGYNPYVFAIHA